MVLFRFAVIYFSVGVDGFMGVPLPFFGSIHSQDKVNPTKKGENLTNQLAAIDLFANSVEAESPI